jgi:hypothetical protein
MKSREIRAAVRRRSALWDTLTKAGLIAAAALAAALAAGWLAAE